MKLKLNFLAIALSVSSMAFFSCTKKNADDPLISFRTRKARVCGDWKAESGSIVSADNVNSTKWIIKGSSYNAFDDFGGTASGSATVSFHFKKDGTCSNYIMVGGFISKWSGNWNFSGGIAETKKNNEIIINALAASGGSGNYVYSGNDHHFTYGITELRNKKMQLHLMDKITYPDGTWSSYSEDWVLVPQ